MFLLRIYVVLWVLCICVPVYGAVIWQDGYESGDFSAWRTAERGREAHSLRISQVTVQNGRYAARFELRYTDRRVTDTYRNELSIGHHGKPNIGALNTEYWYGFSIFIPANWQNDSLRDELAQFHVQPDRGEVWRNPPLGFDVYKGNWQIWNRWDRRRIQTNANKHQSGHRLLWSGALHKGQWNSWVVHVKWNYTGNGFLRIWLNDVQVVDDHGPNCYNDGNPRYFKWGIYKRAWSATRPPFMVKTRVIYNDSMRIGDANAGYDAVKPRRESTNAD